MPWPVGSLSGLRRGACRRLLRGFYGIYLSGTFQANFNTATPEALQANNRRAFFMATSDQRRGSSAQRGYGGAWQKARESYLRRHPLCSFHLDRGQVVAASVVDHKSPHKGDPKLFWDKSNWQSLCKQCHDSVKQRIEKSGNVAGCDVNGIPLDRNHHWSQRA